MRQSASALLNLSSCDSEVSVFSVAEIGAGAGKEQANRAGEMLVYGFRGRTDEWAPLRSVTELAAARVTPLKTTAAEITWTDGMKALAPSLAGMRLDLRFADSTFSSFDFDADTGSTRVETLARLDGRPWFVRVKVGERWVYLLGVAEIPDPETVVASAEEELPLVTVAIALLTFVRTHFPGAAWFAPESLANFVIDDPLLRPSYGFVRHAQLADHLDHLGAAATIAFIPWNARRSALQTAELFREGSNLSICVHGYEHIEAEFSTTDLDELRWRAQSALAAMRVHHDLTGVPFEPVMVFPQGKFSSPTMEVLANAGFLAAANSTFLATDMRDAVRLRHLLEPAVTAYGSLPLFRRRSPTYANRFRYDVVIGKPLLLVEHHRYFSDDGQDFRRVIGQVRDISPAVRWAPLGEIARTVHLLRAGRPHHREVRFFSRQFRLRTVETGTYEFTKPERSADVVSVTLNGCPVDFSCEQDILRFQADMAESAQPVEVVVNVRPELPAHMPPTNKRSRLSVALRRYLSEGRDNYIDTKASLHSLRPLGRRLFGQSPGTRKQEGR